MSLTIGRLTFNSPASIGTDEFGTFSFSGRLNNDSVDDMKYYRDEITSLASTLPTVPVSYTGDSTIDGYFQIISATVNMQKISFGGFNYRITAAQLGDSNNLKFESNFTGAVRENNHGISSTTNGQWHALPVNHYNYDADNTFNTVTRVTDEGTQYIRYGTSLKNGSAFHAVNHGDYYKGACKIYSGNRERTGLFYQGAITNSYITNGIIKVSFGEGTNQSRFTTTMYNGSSFATAKEYKIESGSSLAEFRGWKTLSLLKNTPQEVSVRLTSHYLANGGGLLTADFSLRRGAHHAVILFSQWTAANFKLSLTTTEAGTKDGNEKYIESNVSTTRYLMGSPNTITFDETNGAITRTSNKKLRALVGYGKDGSSATSFDSAASVYDQYIDNVVESIKPIKP